jgi:2-oxoglutarate ferredoxin oxidoreductase subunit gamma
MTTEVIFAGFGGQGLMVSGRLLALGGMLEDKEVTWLPSYGPEMRGGTANCTVVVSDQPVGSPIITNPSAAVVMNRPSLEKFAPAIKENGLLVVNSSLIDIMSERNDLKQYKIKANHIANEAGSPKSANMVILGAYIGLTKIVSPKVMTDLIKEQFASKPKFIEPNVKCFEKGYELAEKGDEL